MCACVGERVWVCLADQTERELGRDLTSLLHCTDEPSSNDASLPMGNQICKIMAYVRVHVPVSGCCILCTGYKRKEKKTEGEREDSRWMMTIVQLLRAAHAGVVWEGR